MVQKTLSDDELESLWAQTGGNVEEMSRISGHAVRKIYHRRRRFEESTGRVLRASGPHSRDPGVIEHEFPDNQNVEIKDGLLIIFSDAHLIPKYKSTAHRALLKMIRELKPKAVFDLGDDLDFASISRHHRIGWDQPLKVKDELEWVGDCLHEIKTLAGGACLTRRTQGNHDQRFSGKISNTLPQFEGVKGFGILDHIVGWPTTWTITVNDQLFCIHRWKSGMHSKFNETLWAGMSTCSGHEHAQRIYPLTDLRGDRWGVDTGTLAAVWGPHFRYLEGRPRNWRAGFVVAKFQNYKLLEPQKLRVVDEESGLIQWGLETLVV